MKDREAPALHLSNAGPSNGLLGEKLTERHSKQEKFEKNDSIYLHGASLVKEEAAEDASSSSSFLSSSSSSCSSDDGTMADSSSAPLPVVPSLPAVTPWSLHALRTTPFAAHANPIASQLAFLASQVSPSVAAAAAQCALQAYHQAATNKFKGKSGGSKTGKLMKKEAAASEAAAAGAAMDTEMAIVDDPAASSTHHSSLNATFGSLDPNVVAVKMLYAAAVRAHQLACEEEVRLVQLALQATELQMKKVEAKMDLRRDLDVLLALQSSRVQKEIVLAAATKEALALQLTKDKEASDGAMEDRDTAPGTGMTPNVEAAPTSVVPVA